MAIRITYLLLLATFVLGTYLVIALFRRTEIPVPTYVGVGNCEGCHGSTSVGRQYQSWDTSAHARAWGDLQTDRARAAMQSSGLTIDQCAACHTTVGGAPVTALDSLHVVEGVGCERCHGPGSIYALHHTMRDTAKFEAAGGVRGRLADCYSCHARTLPRKEMTCPFQTVPFHADSGWRWIAHPVPTRTSDDSARAAPFHQVEEPKR